MPTWATTELCAQSRAEAVMLYLVQHSVDAQRLLARGYGEKSPSSESDSEDGQATNRRVEFHILERDATDP